MFFVHSVQMQKIDNAIRFQVFLLSIIIDFFFND